MAVGGLVAVVMLDADIFAVAAFGAAFSITPLPEAKIGVP
jgi:hypothetical protein